MVTQLNKFVAQKKTREEELAPELQLELARLSSSAVEREGADGERTGEEEPEGMMMLAEGFTMNAPVAGALAPESQNTVQELVQTGTRMMKESEASVLRSTRVVDEMLTVSRGTAVMLEQQSEQMAAVTADLNRIQFSMGKAKQLITDMARMMVMDKCIMVLVALVLGGIAAVLGLKYSGVQFIPSPPPPPPATRHRRLLRDAGAGIEWGCWWAACRRAEAAAGASPG